MVDSTREYVGRFAPTPSGPLHFGSLVAAVGSWLDARCNGGLWLLRIDDLDGPRVAPGSIASILNTLEQFGLTWDGPVFYQSEQLDAYKEALNRLEKMGRTFGCECTRKTLQGNEVYPGTCLNRAVSNARTVRLRCSNHHVEWVDRGLGPMRIPVASMVGDFVLKNAHGIYSYYLANVVDDMHLGITHVVRGADLELATAAHLYLQWLLGGPRIHYHHLPLAYDEHGFKLSKQTHAPPVDPQRASPTLRRVLEHLGLMNVEEGSVEEMLGEASVAWSKSHQGWSMD